MKNILLAFTVLAPIFTFAANLKTDYLRSFFGSATTIITSLAVLVISITVLYLILSVVSFMRNNMIDKAKRAEAATGILWSVIAIAVMVSIWGIVSILQGMFFSDLSGQVFNGSIK
ncbi:MAG: hypothetical protein WCF94_00285 [bacterium]